MIYKYLSFHISIWFHVHMIWVTEVWETFPSVNKCLLVLNVSCAPFWGNSFRVWPYLGPAGGHIFHLLAPWGPSWCDFHLSHRYVENYRGRKESNIKATTFLPKAGWRETLEEIPVSRFELSFRIIASYLMLVGNALLSPWLLLSLN